MSRGRLPHAASAPFDNSSVVGPHRWADPSKSSAKSGRRREGQSKAGWGRACAATGRAGLGVPEKRLVDAVAGSAPVRPAAPRAGPVVGSNKQGRNPPKSCVSQQLFERLAATRTGSAFERLAATRRGALFTDPQRSAFHLQLLCQPLPGIFLPPWSGTIRTVRSICPVCRNPCGAKVFPR